MRRWIAKAGAIAGALAAVGFLIAASGLVPVKASSGHWAITAWLLHFAMRRSVVTHTLGMPVPALDDPDLALMGAGHYEHGCRPCHGSPDLDLPRIARAMTPAPPDLASRIPEWKPQHLFYIVKHGVKFTGMPAWPTLQRDDEVWAMVAFLRTLPSLDAKGYRRLVHDEGGEGDPVEIPAAITVSCAGCHGVDGRGRGSGAFPVLAGQRPAYLHAALRAYARGQRHSGVMGPVAGGLRPDEARALARYYGELGQPPATRADRAASGAVERGHTIARRGIPSQGVPSCADCHGPGPGRRNPRYPVLAGQHADYIALQIELFRTRRRGGSAYAHLMLPVASRLTSKQAREVALYYESLPGLGGSVRRGE